MKKILLCINRENSKRKSEIIKSFSKEQLKLINELFYITNSPFTYYYKNINLLTKNRGS